MNENVIMFLAPAKILLVIVAALLYSMGGRATFDKSLRRFISPAVLVLGTVLFSKIMGTYSSKIWIAAAISYAGFVLTWHMGYGIKFHKDILWRKIALRIMVGTMATVAGIPLLIAGTGVWDLVFYQWGFACIGQVTGVFRSGSFGMARGFGPYLFVPFYV